MRGAGEVLGTQQTGMLQMRIADLICDQHLIPEVQKVAFLLWVQYQDVAKAIIARWIGEKEKYGCIV
jgi:ATP-dependent DNA helicase RecG